MSYLTVKQFYEKYPNTRFFKVMYAHLEPVKVGLNKKEFVITPHYGGGILFSSQKNLYNRDVYENRGYNCLLQPPTQLYEVFFTDEASDAKIHIFPNVFICDKCILGEPIVFNPFICDIENEEFYKKVISQNGLLINYVKEQTPELCMLAVQQNGFALKYINNKTIELCMLAVQQNGIALEYVPTELQNDSAKHCLYELAVQQNGLALEYVKEQTYEICKLAVQEHGFSLYYVNEQFKTIELCKMACEQDEEAICHVPQIFVKNMS